MRDAFTPYNAREYPLDTTIASLGEGRAAVHSGAAFQPQGIVVDEYVKDSANGVYRLTNVATDLLRCAQSLLHLLSDSCNNHRRSKPQLLRPC